MSIKEVIDALKNVDLREAGINQNVAKMVKDAKFTGGTLTLVIEPPREGLEDVIRVKVVEALEKLPDVKNVDVKFVKPKAQQPPPQFQQPMFTRKKVPGVKHIVAVGSGKGGVGKSTVATNLALALSRLGYKVGLLDADVYGPSVPTLMGLKGERVNVDQFQRLIPLEKYGIKVLSIGFMLPSEDTPVIWRGPMLMKALTEFLFSTKWGDLDYLIMDLPPGTGDVQITLAQNVQLDGALVVTTPQDVALSDVKKAVTMFKEVNIPVLGVVENMAYFICPSDGQKYYIFGKGKVAQFASNYGLKILGSIPIDPDLAQRSDEGKPVVVSEPDSEVSKAFMGIAKVLTETLQKKN
ncbi:MAG: Mrp/NBP35 family ATP-binding protein [Aquificae bacterium]|nr:Mrp/NBP35 family ATP-binding protein [Aquificota bacterium]